ncbi:MAG TPA: peptidoglycan recognition family protein [Actinomycetota bacterium]|nr:peptidoglycan recognition family protein [Actinomycetota bacterium]
MGDRTVRRTSLESAVAIAVLITAFLPAATVPVAATSRSDPGWDLQPQILRKPIPFPDLRRDQMAAYSRRHYGRSGWRLAPAVIVQHYTGGSSFASAWNTFASNARHLGEKPGACAHFLIDNDGTIYQLVDREVRCRHAIGLNHVSIGIEHVGRSAAAVLRNPAMMRSSLRLTLWLMATYGIEARNVIGHAESLESPFHYERYAEWRCMTHADFDHHDMRAYRDRLRDLARANDVPVGPSPEWVDPRC